MNVLVCEICNKDGRFLSHDTTTSDSSSDMSGFAVALGFVIYATIWLIAPGNYFVEVDRTSDTALVSYLVALVSVAIGIMGMGFELSDKTVSTFIGRLVRGNVPRDVYDSPSSSAWGNLGIAVGTLILPTALIHLVGIELLDLTGAIGSAVKIVVMLSVAIPVWFFAWFVDDIIIKPLFQTPAKRLLELPNDTATSKSHAAAETEGRVGLSGIVRRTGGLIVPVADFVAALYLFWQIIAWIIETIN